jgi:hypothetical protein
VTQHDDDRLCTRGQGNVYHVLQQGDPLPRQQLLGRAETFGSTCRQHDRRYPAPHFDHWVLALHRADRHGVNPRISQKITGDLVRGVQLLCVFHFVNQGHGAGAGWQPLQPTQGMS